MKSHFCHLHVAIWRCVQHYAAIWSLRMRRKSAIRIFPGG
jgi:hypothetical protein